MSDTNVAPKAENSIIEYAESMTASFDEQGFNEVDGLILAQIANFDFSASGIDLYSGESKTIEELYHDMDRSETPAHDRYVAMEKRGGWMARDLDLLKALAESDRYKDLVVSNYVKDPVKTDIPGFPSVGEDQYMEQFSAAIITFEQNGQTYNYVSYAATNGTTDGWAEDMSMIYSMNTQAQSDSLVYMNLVGEMTEGYIIGGGHSKGGNDFEYAFLFCDEDVRERIVKGYVYDNPGLNDTILAQTRYYEEYKQITEGSCICPQDSIVGQLLQESGNASFIYSIESGGLAQHNPFGWEVDLETGSFVSAEQSELSRFLNAALDEAVANMSQEERKALFEFVAFLLYNSGGEGLEGLKQLLGEGWIVDDSLNYEKLEQVLAVISEDLRCMTPEEREAFADSLGRIIAGFKAVMQDNEQSSKEQWIDEKKQQIAQSLQEVWDATAAWAMEQRDRFAEFLKNVYEATVLYLDKAAGLVKYISTAWLYVSANPLIILDTDKMQSYAQRIEAVNRRISSLDARLDALYWKVGLLDLWNLVQADLLTSYSWRLLRCASYLNETASEFEALESSLLKEL